MKEIGYLNKAPGRRARARTTRPSRGKATDASVPICRSRVGLDRIRRRLRQAHHGRRGRDVSGRAAARRSSSSARRVAARRRCSRPWRASCVRRAARPASTAGRRANRAPTAPSLSGFRPALRRRTVRDNVATRCARRAKLSKSAAGKQSRRGVEPGRYRARGGPLSASTLGRHEAARRDRPRDRRSNPPCS